METSRLGHHSPNTNPVFYLFNATFFFIPPHITFKYNRQMLLQCSARLVSVSCSRAALFIHMIVAANYTDEHNAPEKNKRCKWGWRVKPCWPFQGKMPGGCLPDALPLPDSIEVDSTYTQAWHLGVWGRSTGGKTSSQWQRFSFILGTEACAAF